MLNSQIKLEIREYEKKIKEINEKLDDDRYMQEVVAGSLIGRKHAYMEFIEKIKEWCE
jgi:hypothetical protein